jgi:hypothetical protein
MPTPDTEALDARLRAVERALTDSETTIGRAAGTGSEKSTAPAEQGAETDGSEADGNGNDEPDEGEREQEKADSAAVPEPVVGEADTEAGPGTTDDAGPAEGTERSPPSRAELERRLLDLEAAVQALRGCLERKPRGDGPEGPATGASVSVPDSDPTSRPAARDAWPDDLAADGGRSPGDSNSG